MSVITPPHSQRAPRFLLSRFVDSPWFAETARRFSSFLGGDAKAELYIENLSNPSIKALLIAAFYERLKQPVIVICPDAQTAVKYQFELEALLGDLPPERAGAEEAVRERVERYPAEDFSPYDLSVFPVQALKAQYRILNRLQQGDSFILLVSAKSLLIKHLGLSEIDRYAIHLKTGQIMAPEVLIAQCLALGYVRSGMVMDPGEFSSRGDIFDLYPINGDPVRIEFFGDTVENIRVIDVENQRSIERVTELVAIPRAGLILTDENRERLPDLLQERLKAQSKLLSGVGLEGLEMTIQNQVQGLEQSFLPDGIDYYAPLLHEDYKTLADYVPENAIAILDDWAVLENNLGSISDRLNSQLQEGIQKGRLLDLGYFQYHLTDAQALSLLKTRAQGRILLDALPLDNEASKDKISQKGLAGSTASLDTQRPDQFKADMVKACEYMAGLRREQYQIFVTTDHPQRVIDACKEWDIPADYWPEPGSEEASKAQNTALLLPESRDVIVARSGPQEGFLLPNEKIAHFTDAELYGRRLKRALAHKSKPTKREDIDVINSIHDLRQSDFVVHAKHGIGQFVELTRISIEGEIREYITVQYGAGDRLHVPIDQLNMLSRYRGAGDKPPKLSKMGGIEWGKVKSKVKKSIQTVARDLQILYAARNKITKLPFEPDSPWQVEMEEAFPYTETPDQWQAILDTKKDMESERPMDRLVCGDVGFGKTEVALRALFKCVLSGRQAAVLVPTTILAQQHFNTLTDRFSPYPVRIGLLSRFRSPQEQKEVITRLNDGECDIVVGTHRLLQKDIRLKNLGLVVVDEEQRFGVTHKEKMKHLRTEVDVLTLSATPIPRTLYMSLSGIREMSLINTPPTNRAPIKTFVGPYNPAQIRMALLQEKDRGGQIYFVHNRVQTIYAKLEELQALVPEVRFAIGHGQMNEHDLENVMLDFAQHQYDVLICTTIIETGLDIPNVNTIIVDRADRLGLAQLYQIRGRVGRSNVQAYAFCYYDPDRNLSEDARDRLRAIREFTSLGSGYQIAMRDLEIRGVGNVLGSEQHGHMVSVGFDLYCQMLEETIEELNTGVSVEEQEPSIIDINVTAFIPDKWVGDRDVKLMEYKRLASVKTELAIDITLAEWKDRFGEIPPQTLMLVDLVRLRILATALKIPQIRTDEEFLRITVPYNLQEWMYLQKQLPPELGRKARWVPGVTAKQGSLPVLLIKLLGMTGDDQVDLLKNLLSHLARIIAQPIVEAPPTPKPVTPKPRSNRSGPRVSRLPD
jgi:transcription-repair coupling factor (superfamily II helicase)